MTDDIVPDDWYCVINTSSHDIPSYMNCLESKNDAMTTCVALNKMDLNFGNKLKHQIMTVAEWRENHCGELVARINEMDDIYKWWWVFKQVSSVTVLLKFDETCVIICGSIVDPIKFDTHLGTSNGVSVLLDILNINHKVV